MPTLDWIGKQAVLHHHRDVPYRLIHCDKDLSAGDPDAGNLLVQGDNLEALKALLPYYAGKVKCIYIDPPYNTGNEGWVYNDNVNSPEMKKWLGQVVGKEADDLSRHDKWLCMMYPRLRLLREFLSEDGAIFVSMDDNEDHHLRIMLEEIFGPSNFIANCIWHKMDSPKNTAIHFSEDHDYITVFAKSSDLWRPHLLERNDEMLARYKNPDNDPRGPWLLSDLAARNFYAQGRYSITTPKGRVIDGPPAGSYWRVSKDRFDELEEDNRIWWGQKGDNRPGIKRFLSEVRQGIVPQTIWHWKDVGSTRNAKQALSQIMGSTANQDVFITPKPVNLIKRILEIASDRDSIILDSFAGSGTTGHAVLEMNKQDEGSRRYICVEIEAEVAKDITAKRLRRISEGYDKVKGEKVEKVDGLGSGFRFCRLGTPLFDEFGSIAPEVEYADLAAHIFFSETGSPIPQKADGNTTLLGTFQGRAVYLLYDAATQGFALEAAGNTLTPEILAELPSPSPEFDGMRVIYAEGCTVSAERLKAENAVFKQIPYEIGGA